MLLRTLSFVFIFLVIVLSFSKVVGGVDFLDRDFRPIVSLFLLLFGTMYLLCKLGIYSY